MFGSTNANPPPEKKLANIDANQINTNQQGLPEPYMAGRRRIAIHYIAPAYNGRAQKVETTVGKGQKQTTGYIYFADLAGLICLGGRHPLDKIFRHIIDSEIAWENSAGLTRPIGGGETPITIPDRGQTWLHWGTPDQAIDIHVLTAIGPPPSTPGFDSRVPTTWPGYNPGGGHPDPP